jgi:microcystin-dependent protein
MGQFFGIENIKTLEIDSATTLNWPAGSRLRIGGQAYAFETDTALDLATDIDTGSVAADTLYYVYAVFNSGTQLRYLRYSLSDEAVDGEDQFRLIGFLQTNSNSEIRRVQNSLDGNIPLADKAPVGSIISLGTGNVPTGYLACDGSIVSRTTYADLFAEIGTAHGEGDGSTTFHLPDYRGRFLRGADEGAGRDPDAGTRIASNTGGASGDNVGSVQDEAINGSGLSMDSAGQHRHPVRGTNFAGTTGTLNYLGAINVSNSQNSVASLGTDQDGSHVHTFSGGSSETRGKNANVKYAIKY